MHRLAKDGLDDLFAALRGDGWTVLGPTVRDGAIRLGEIESGADLPVGWTDAQAPGRYRLQRQGDRVFDGYVVGPDSLRTQRAPAREVLYRAERRPDGKLGFTPSAVEGAPTATVGVRACDLAAMRIQEAVFESGPFVDPRHRARRERSLLVAVGCTTPGDLCFCASTGTGPGVAADAGADLVLTERADDFLVEATSPRGEALLARMPTEAATDDDAAWLDDAMERAAASMGRHVEVEGLPERLFASLDHPRWDDVADRCLACGSCTSVCPTCFCTTTEDRSSIDGSSAERVRLWDSCFTEGHGHVHGGGYRAETRERYRQWLTHKVAGWVSQFGTSGCVGCGRCIAWCPVGIDITEELAALAAAAAEERLPSPPEHAQHEADDLVPTPAKVVAARRESRDVITLRVAAPSLAKAMPGQFTQLSLPALGEAPISISGFDGEDALHTIRAVGATTRALAALRPGAEVGVRGPYGRPWPLESWVGRPVTVIAGGIGLAPLRGAIRTMLARPADFPEVHLLYGARSPGDVLFASELARWEEHPTFRLHLTVDHATPEWTGHVGVVTRLLERATAPPDGVSLMCGPEIMMRYAVEGLARLGIADERIWVTLERHMECATGFCGRCQLGPFFVCRDGPVFSFDQIRLLFATRGF